VESGVFSIEPQGKMDTDVEKWTKFSVVIVVVVCNSVVGGG